VTLGAPEPLLAGHKLDDFDGAKPVHLK